MDALVEYEILLVLLLLGVALGAVPLIVPRLISPRYSGPKTEEVYECGVDTVGSAWIRFGMAYYLFALIFVAFEVDVLYLFPVALVGAATAAAARTEIHVMENNNGRMTMDRVDSLNIAAGATLELKSGASHLMLLQLLRPLKAGDEVTIELDRIGRLTNPVVDA